MNSLKSVFVVAVLASLACGVYVSLNRNNNDASTPPAGAAPGVPALKVQAPPFGAPGSSAGTPGPASPAANAAGAAGSLAPRAGISLGNSPPETSLATPPTATIPALSGLGPVAGAGLPSGNAGPATAPTGQAPPSPAVIPYPSNLAAPGPGGPGFAGPGAIDATLPSQRKGALSTKFESLMQAVEAKLDEGRLAEAQLSLSGVYGDPELAPDQAKQLTRLLDQMAGTVIYSRQHLLEQPYHIQPGDTLDKIAESYSVPARLLAKINGIRDPQNLPPGRDLKVMRGPFSAQIDLDKFELTLMLKGRYAGRFPIGTGADSQRFVGSYVVRDKKAGAAADSNGPPATGADALATRPWLDLGNNIAIHATVDPRGIGRADNRGIICLGDRDLDDVCGILSIGSQVVIRK